MCTRERKERLTNVSGSIFMRGVEPLNFMSCLLTLRVSLTVSILLARLYDWMAPLVMLALETKSTLADGTRG